MRVGMGHGGEHFVKQREACIDVQALQVAVAVDALAFDQFNHQIRLPTECHACIQQMRNVRVRQARQDVTLALETLRPGATQERQVQQFDGHRPFKAPVFPACTPHAARSALA